MSINKYYNSFYKLQSINQDRFAFIFIFNLIFHISISFYDLDTFSVVRIQDLIKFILKMECILVYKNILHFIINT